MYLNDFSRIFRDVGCYKKKIAAIMVLAFALTMFNCVNRPELHHTLRQRFRERYCHRTRFEIAENRASADCKNGF